VTLRCLALAPEATGVEIVGGRTVVTVDKPSSTDGEYLFNSQFSIATGGTGWAYRFGVVIALGDPPSSANLVYQPIVDSWEIEEGGDLFVVFGEHNADARGLIGKFNAAGGTGAQILNFQIISSSPTTRSALVQIEQRTFTGPAYGATLDDTVVTVYDTDGTTTLMSGTISFVNDSTVQVAIDLDDYEGTVGCKYEYLLLQTTASGLRKPLFRGKFTLTK
jgi:hypothetical protein